MQNKPPTKKHLNVFVYGLTLILCLFSWKAYRANNGKISALLLSLVLLLLITYFIKKDFVIKFYHVWMRCVSVIGMIITGILMILIFYLIFTPVGIFLRIIRKDVLHLKQDKKLKTYWIDKPQITFEKTNYEKQF
ncbi:MAG: hypothetical protein ABIA97_01995 [Candidatus Omnitrophota bacterium]